MPLYLDDPGINAWWLEHGKAIDPEERIWRLTRGQPWLVNALAYETCFEMPAGRDRALPIDRDLIDVAKERLIQQRVTHLDQLADKLREPRVRRIIEPMLAGGTLAEVPEDDIQYLIDLGLCLRYGELTLGIELQVWRDAQPDPLADGLIQIEGYLAGLDLDTGWLIIFDRRTDIPPLAERLTEEDATSPGGRRVRVLRL